MSTAHETLTRWLESSRQQGFLGPMPIGGQIRHALGMAAAVDTAPAAALDLGSGGGVPALVLACLEWPATRWCLVEASPRRAAFLREAATALRLNARVGVLNLRAEEAGRRLDLRHQFDLVIARSFGPPGVTAECAAPFVRKGGAVVVSEPPVESAADRWPPDGLQLLNLVLEAHRVAPVHVVALRSIARCDDRYPRRNGIPSKRPLF